MGKVESAGLWRNRRYLRYRTARVVSLLGSALSGIAYPLLVLHLHGTAVEAGGVTTCWLTAKAVCRLPGGHLADRVDRRALMISMDVVRLAVVGSIPITVSLGVIVYAQIIAVAVIEGATAAAFGPASTALLRDLVPAERLSRALGHSQGIYGATALLGPTLGGLCYGLNPLLPFILDAASYGVSAIFLLDSPAVRLPRRSPGDMDRSATDRRATAGLRWLWRHPTVLRVALFGGVANLTAAAMPVALVVVLRERGTSSAAIGVVVACAGAGTIVGSLGAHLIIRRLDPARLCLTNGLVWTAGLATLAGLHAPWAIAPILILLFLLAPAAGITMATISLGAAPRQLLGRLSAAEQLISTSLAAAGPVVAGLLLQALGVSWMWLLLGGCMLAATAAAIVPLLLKSAPAAAPEQGSVGQVTVSAPPT